MNVPEIYARVCAACPEAKIDGLYPPNTLRGMWSSDGKGYVVSAELVERDAVAIIENSWTKLLLARGCVLTHHTENEEYFEFMDAELDKVFVGPTILEAAAARLENA